MPENFPSVKSAYGVVRVPIYETTIVRYRGNREQRNARLPVPYHRITYQFKTLSVAEADAIYNFFLARQGSFDPFYLQNNEEAYRSKAWTPNTVYAAGAIIRPVTVNGRSYKCTTPGTSHATTQPTWPTTYHGSVADNTAAWTENSYHVRFADDMLTMEAMYITLYNLGQVSFIEVAP